ncbi:MAG: sarcosine oxidase subunit beta family protein, partial [Rhodoferax sp.]|nr:sarcosine oxidase subunit beta family protein [Rhodoferax sp.]
PKKSYDVIIVGGGGHGLATAYYLAKNHGIRNVAILEKGYIGGGNVGRNTTIVRSNYMMQENTGFYEHSMSLWRGMSEDLNYNVMFSPRGYLFAACSQAALDGLVRRANTMRLNGIRANILTREEMVKEAGYLDYSDQARFPIYGGMLQPDAGTARHDAVAWGYARAADQMGVDIIQNCEVQDYLWDKDRIIGVRTNRGDIQAGKVGIAVAGHTSVLAQKAGLKLPIESHVLQAFVTESIKPVVHHVAVWSATYFYVSQSDKGGLVFGGHIDRYNSYAQRGNLANWGETMQGLASLVPFASRLRLLRSWGGIMDMTPDGSPIITTTPVPGLYLNGGWCYGGFKATPASGWCFAHTIAHDQPHPLNAGFTMERFAKGRYIDEAGYGPYNHLQ